MLECTLTEGQLLRFEGTLSDFVRVAFDDQTGLVPSRCDVMLFRAQHCC